MREWQRQCRQSTPAVCPADARVEHLRELMYGGFLSSSPSLFFPVLKASGMYKLKKLQVPAASERALSMQAKAFLT